MLPYGRRFLTPGIVVTKNCQTKLHQTFIKTNQTFIQTISIFSDFLPKMLKIFRTFSKNSDNFRKKNKVSIKTQKEHSEIALVSILRGKKNENQLL